MSIQTEIDRIAANVTAALTACTDKGASVPDGSTSDDLATIIAAIEAGGGGTIHGMSYVCGTFAAASDTKDVSVQHELGKVPIGALWWTDEDVNSLSSRCPIVGCAILQDTTTWYGVRAEVTEYYNNGNLSAYGGFKSATASINGGQYDPTVSVSTNSSVYTQATATSVKFHASANFPAGVEYKYVLFGGA